MSQPSTLNFTEAKPIIVNSDAMVSALLQWITTLTLIHSCAGDSYSHLTYQYHARFIHLWYKPQVIDVSYYDPEIKRRVVYRSTI